MWLLDPRPNLPSIVGAVEQGFELSEASNTPVMLQLRIRSCHMTGEFVAKDNIAPPMTVAEAAARPVRDSDRVVVPPANFLHEIEKAEKRWPAGLAFVRDNKLNEWFGPGESDIGIIVQGGVTTGLLNAVVAEDLPGPGSVFLHVDWSFKAPVRPGDEITAEVEVLEAREDKPLTKLRTTITNQAGTVVLDGSALVWTEPLD